MNFGKDKYSKLTAGEIYDLKRKRLVEQTIENFKSLVTDFGYSPPKHRKPQQDNGTIILDELHDKNKVAGRLVIISNAYHPFS